MVSPWFGEKLPAMECGAAIHRVAIVVFFFLAFIMSLFFSSHVASVMSYFEHYCDTYVTATKYRLNLPDTVENVLKKRSTVVAIIEFTY